MSPAAVPHGNAMRGLRRVLLIEDDDADSVLIEALLEDAPEQWEVLRCPSIASARRSFDESTACVVVDLGLPGMEGLEALDEALSMAGSAAVVVLTGLEDQGRGAQAVAAGAQDYLVKGSVDAAGLSKALRFAVERKAAEVTSQRLHEAELQRRANQRLERGLLPKPLLTGRTIDYRTRYRPGGRQIELGGDFFDLLELPDGTVRAVIGDVSGHGPDEAALGVAMRAAWRALVLSGHGPERVLASMQAMLTSERMHDEMFVTCCDVTVSSDRKRLTVLLAGHPAPLVLGASVVSLEGKSGPALGLTELSHWPECSVALPEHWGLMLFTDGLVEGRTATSRTWGSDGLCRLVESHWAPGCSLDVVVDAAMQEAESSNEGPLTDDVAVLFIAARS